MDIKVRNKVVEIQQTLEQEEQRISLSDPVAKMMLVAVAHLLQDFRSISATKSCKEAICRHNLRYL